MKKIILLPLFLLPLLCRAQIYKSDWENFWMMRDSVLLTRDTGRQLAEINRLYIAKASEGLKAFMRNKEGLDRKWLALIQSDPVFWNTLQEKKPIVTTAVSQLQKQIDHFRQLYPELQPAQSYFLVGLRQQGGTVRGNLSLIGVEVVLREPAMGEAQLVRMAVHEYAHTQQKRPDFQKINVLTSSIREGACDFVAELVTGLLNPAPYMSYGLAHEKAVWSSFQKEMNTQNNDNWVSTGNNPSLPAPDLGYFVGYQICEAYYKKAADKRSALKQIIELDYANPAAVNEFLKQSEYQAN